MKSITPVDHYVCNLSEDLIEMARNELNETDELRENSIKSIRDWVLNNPRIIKTRLDSIFILRFLRQKKYNLEKAKESMERWLVLYTAAGIEFTLLSRSFDFINNIHFRNMIKNKNTIYLKNKHSKDPAINLCKLISFDVKTEGITKEWLTLTFLIQELILDIEENQIRGTVLIQDCADASIRHAFMMNFSSWRKLVKAYEVRIEIRRLYFKINFIKISDLCL